ncbi:thiamine pyrophosphate-dependent enzyme [Rhodalgimonas zhirmunskyi]|uniref:Thiamine pyrophosphate-binding protein n=1 Tax=Rhodalgimonas zhirmunskyi TaxID=2964767 RepID=A0AAJ1UA35_9RHOB|nr:thiamine pyrophosphate-dependent enzyme [Rhodoalgimonas zhirmunskyi]MDQ2094023.1 thiamine pyrophosphate-binding protein [Rhodoalgimonas zhirmunskyi]
MSKTVSEVVVDALEQAGAKRVYGIVGDTINHFTDAVRSSSLEWIHVRHEEVGALAAGGESYMTGELSICAGTTGPGSLHFVNGIFESHRNGAPVVMIASNIDRAEAGLNFPQEVDQKKIYEQASVFCEAISHPDQARRIVVQAAQAALTKRGVAVVIVNGDMFKETAPDELPWAVHRADPIVRPSEDEIETLAALVEEAEKITIYAGIGARGAERQVKALAEHLGAPVAHTTRSKEFIEPDMPNNVGMTGILGNKAGMEAVAGCDLLLCLGSDFAYTQFYPEGAKIVQVDVDPTHLGRRSPIHLGLVGDVGDTIDSLLPKIGKRAPGKHLSRAQAQYRKDIEGYRDSAQSKDPTLIHPQHLTRCLDEMAARDAVFTADGGSPMVWLLRHLSANGERRFLTSLLHGTMANAYPQAMGIQLAFPGRQVIALCGDGGMTMLMGDLLTLVQEEIPVKLLIFNNASLGFVEMEQRVEGLLDSYTGLKNPDFGAMARSIGMQGARVECADDLEGAMRDWLDATGPALLDVKVSRMELVMPPKIEAGQVASTALFGMKAVLNGRGDEVIDLLRDNFLR